MAPSKGRALRHRAPGPVLSRPIYKPRKQHYKKGRKKSVPSTGRPASAAVEGKLTAAEQADLTEIQYGFALAYLGNGFNARQAYLSVCPHVTHGSADVQGHRMLRNVKVRAFLLPQLEEHWNGVMMEGVEALARVARDARADITLLYDEAGELMKPRDWPIEIKGSVKSIQDGPYGLKVSLVDTLQARRIILEQTGKLKSPGDSLDALAAAIRGDLQKHGRTGDEEM
jgi:phage terminase small subunit